LPSGLLRRQRDLDRREELILQWETALEARERRLALCERLRHLLGPWGSWTPEDAVASALERILDEHRDRMSDLGLQRVRDATRRP
jgi:hypothetical protein